MKLVALIIPVLCLSACRSIQADVEHYDQLSQSERSLRVEETGDSLAASGFSEDARNCYITAALLRTPEDTLRNGLAWKAAEVSDTPSVLCAQLLLERPDSLAPYRSIALGGSGVVRDILSYISRYNCVMPEYLYLVIADSLVSSGDAQKSLDILANVPDDLPDAASRRRTILLHRSLLETGQSMGCDSILTAAELSGDDELLSLLCHDRGVWLLQQGLPQYREMLVRSLILWPAAPVHSSAYELMRYEILQDSVLAHDLAQSFYSGGLWNELYDIAINSSKPDPHLWYLAARTRDRLGFYGESVEMLEKYLEEWPSGDDLPDAMIYLGRNQGRMGNWQRGFEVLQQYGEDHPDHGRIGNLPWYIGDLLTENRQWHLAIPWFRQTLEQYPGNVTADDAHFYLCFCLLKSGDLSGSLKELDSFISRWNGSVYLSSARYWKGKLLFGEGNPEGRAVLESLIADSPYSLPAFFAREVLGMQQWKPLFTTEPLADWMIRHEHPPANPPDAAMRGLFLQRAGLRSYAVGEFLRAEEIVGGPDLLADFYLDNDVWERRPISGYSMWDLSGVDGDRPRELWMLRYQMAWPELVVPAGERYGLDSLFAWAIIRNESMFQPDCYSTAGARGLIQMIPSTSEYVADAMGWDDYSPDRLYDPAVSIEYGISYISDINREFQGDPVMTAAAYNGGPHNAVHWGAFDMQTDEFFSLITYNETKNYTQNVHHAYVIYRSLYLER